MTMNRRTQIVGLISWLGVCFVAAALGGLASASAGSFYRELSSPEWAPPGWLFGPAWSVLYCMMAVAAWLVWRVQGWNGARRELSLFLLQLLLNAAWTWLFFGLRLGAVAFIEILVLWLAILVTLIAFWRVRPIAGALLIPYLCWVSFASALTYAIWTRNPGLL